MGILSFILENPDFSLFLVILICCLLYFVRLVFRAIFPISYEAEPNKFPSKSRNSPAIRRYGGFLTFLFSLFTARLTVEFLFRAKKGLFLKTFLQKMDGQETKNTFFNFLEFILNNSQITDADSRAVRNYFLFLALMAYVFLYLLSVLFLKLVLRLNLTEYSILSAT